MEETPLPTLQLDALIQIFHKLPIRSLLQCKLVCKDWCSLISDPFFKSNYTSSSIPNHPINLMMIPKWGFRRWAKSSLRYEIDGFDNPLVCRSQPLPGNSSFEEHNLTIMGSWNGLVALYHYDGDLYLLNPCTGEEISVHVALDPFKFSNNRHSNGLKRHAYGLSYDSSNREYKVVLSFFEENIINLCVVSFKHGEWKLKSQSSPADPHTARFRDSTGTVVNGVPHWIVQPTPPTNVRQLCYFDHCKEEFQEMAKPKEWDSKRLRSLGVLDGKLAATLYNQDCGSEVWILKDFSNPKSWASLLVIVAELRYVSPLSLMNEEEVLIDVYGGEELMIYNYKSRTTRRLQPKIKRKLYNIISYFPSLFSPNTTTIIDPVMSHQR